MAWTKKRGKMKRGCGAIIPLIGILVFIGLFELTRYYADTTPFATFALWYFGLMIVGFAVWFILEIVVKIDPDVF
jgi:hypothetical protein